MNSERRAWIDAHVHCSECLAAAIHCPTCARPIGIDFEPPIGGLRPGSFLPIDRAPFGCPACGTVLQVRAVGICLDGERPSPQAAPMPALLPGHQRSVPALLPAAASPQQPAASPAARLRARRFPLRYWKDRHLLPPGVIVGSTLAAAYTDAFGRPPARDYSDRCVYNFDQLVRALDAMGRPGIYQQVWSAAVALIDSPSAWALLNSQTRLSSLIDGVAVVRARTAWFQRVTPFRELLEQALADVLGFTVSLQIQEVSIDFLPKPSSINCPNSNNNWNHK